MRVQRGPNFSGVRASAKSGWAGAKRRSALPVGAGSQIPLVCLRKATRPIPARRQRERGPLRRPPCARRRRRRLRKAVRGKAHESYGVAFELRVDPHRSWRDALLDTSPVARARENLSAIAARATPEMASAGLPLQYSCRETNLPLAPGAISYADGALERVRDSSWTTTVQHRPVRGTPVETIWVYNSVSACQASRCN